jgi:hypothetical protein
MAIVDYTSLMPMTDKEIEILWANKAARDKELTRMTEMLVVVRDIAIDLSLEEIGQFADLMHRIHQQGRQTEKSQHEF